MELPRLICELAGIYGHLPHSTLRCTFAPRLSEAAFRVLIEQIRGDESSSSSSSSSSSPPPRRWKVKEHYTLTEKVYADHLIDWSRPLLRSIAPPSEEDGAGEKKKIEGRLHEKPYGGFTARISDVPVLIECYGLEVKPLKGACALPTLEIRRRSRHLFSNTLLFKPNQPGVTYVVCCDEIHSSLYPDVRRSVTIQLLSRWHTPVIKYAPFIVLAVCDFIDAAHHALSRLSLPLSLSSAPAHVEAKRKHHVYVSTEMHKELEDMIVRFREAPHTELELRAGRMVSSDPSVFQSGVEEHTFWRSVVRYLRVHPDHKVIETWVDSLDRFAGEWRATATRETTLTDEMTCVIKSSLAQYCSPLLLPSAADEKTVTRASESSVRASLSAEIPGEFKEFTQQGPQTALRAKRRLTIRPDDKFLLSWSIVLQLTIHSADPKEFSQQRLLEHGIYSYEIECEFNRTAHAQRYTPHTLAEQALAHLAEMIS